MRYLFVFIVTCLILCVGCATTTFHVNVDSLSSKLNQSYKKYILFPGNKDILPNDLQFQEFSQYVNRALISEGFTPTENIDEAELAIFLGYGIGNPEEHLYSYSIPVYGQTGVSSSSTYGNINTYGNSGSYSSRTTYTPQYGVTGYNSGVGSYVTYFRYILLTAFDLNEWRKSQKEVQVWKTTITSSGSSEDLRRVFPVLIGASKDYIGKNTGKKIKIVLEESDKRVLEIKSVDEK